MVFVGTTVRLKDTTTGNEECYKLVGEMTGTFVDDIMEVTPSSNLGLGLIKARVGETIRVDLPRGVKIYEILEIM
jgi:transcription elongation factor GreA